MGEVQGSLWTTTLFIVLFVGMVTMLFWAIDTMNYRSTIYAVEDNIKAGNFEYITQLSDSFNVCGTVYDTTTDCSGIIEVNEEEHYVTYQLSFNGLIGKIEANSSNDTIVLLPY